MDVAKNSKPPVPDLLESVGSSPILKAFTDNTKNIPRDTVDTTARDLLVFLDAFVEPILNKFSFFIFAPFFRHMEKNKIKPNKIKKPDPKKVPASFSP